jgi:hypothetical protein
MARSALLLVLTLTVLLSACGLGDQEASASPTPFPTAAPSQRITTAAPIPIALVNLAANPDFFLGATLQLAGQFQRLPRLECEGESHRSPASWALVSDGYLANASGMDRQLRSLIAEGQQITVEGRWLKYEGPVGCGDSAQDQAIWYLSIDRVLDPHPLVRASATPYLSAQVPTTAAILLSTEEATVEGGEEALGTPTLAVPPTLPIIEGPVATPPPVEPTGTLPAYPGATPSFTPDFALPSPTAAPNATPTVGTPGAAPSVTLTGTPPTPTATVSSAASVTPSGSVVEKGSMEEEDLKIDILAASTVHRWTMDLVAGDSITVTVSPGPMADIVLSIQDSNGIGLVNEQNLAPAGEVETITNVNISSPGIYSVLVKTAQGVQTDYALMYMTADSYSFNFKGRLTEGVARNDSIPENVDHFWFFNAESGQSVSIDVMPADDGDPYLELYDPEGSRMLTIDDTGAGELEYLDNYTLLKTGLYGLRVAEFDFLPMSYQVTVSKP